MLRQIRCGEHPARVVLLRVAFQHAFQDSFSTRGQPGVARDARLAKQRVGERDGCASITWSADKPRLHVGNRAIEIVACGGSRGR
jgi:hypothetical protein